MIITDPDVIRIRDVETIKRVLMDQLRDYHNNILKSNGNSTLMIMLEEQMTKIKNMLLGVDLVLSLQEKNKESEE